MCQGVISQICNAFKSKRKFLKALLLLCLPLLLTSCLEVKHGININKDGSGEARLEVAVQKEWASQLIPKLKSDIPKGWSIVEEKEKEGKHVVIINRKFKKISELNDDEARYSFSSERKGFLKKSYILEVAQLKSSDMPFPYEITIKVPGSIDETDGSKISSGEVKWNLQGLRKGTKLSIKSSAFALPDFASLKESFNKVFNKMFYREAIVFLRDKNIWVMNSDGKNQRQLTKEGVGNWSVSRNGKIVFANPKTSLSRTSDGQETFKIEDLNLYFLDINIGKAEKLTTDNRSRRGVISYDGTKIIYEKADWTDPDYGCCGKGVWLLDLTDKTQKEIIGEIPIPFVIRSRVPWLTGKEWYSDYNFIWSKDGTKIAFTRSYGKEWPYISYLLYLNKPENLIYIGQSLKDFGLGVNVNDINVLTEKILFDTSSPEKDIAEADLYTYDIKTRESFLLQKAASNGKFSPDGRKISFVGPDGLWVRDSDGKNKKRMYKDRPWDLSWSPDSRIIVFSMERLNLETAKVETEILLIDTDSTKTKKLADNAGIPKWTSIPKITFVSHGIAKIIILIVVVLAGVLFLFGMALITRKAVKAVIHKIPKKSVTPRSIFCPQCGKENSPSASFCTNCGQKLR